MRRGEGGRGSEKEWGGGSEERGRRECGDGNEGEEVKRSGEEGEEVKRSGEEGEEVRGSGEVKGERCVQFNLGEEGEREREKEEMKEKDGGRRGTKIKGRGAEDQAVVEGERGGGKRGGSTRIVLRASM